MNKGERNEITKRKHEKRCKELGLDPNKHSNDGIYQSI